jgi:hypothetical protein
MEPEVGERNVIDTRSAVSEMSPEGEPPTSSLHDRVIHFLLLLKGRQPNTRSTSLHWTAKWPSTGYWFPCALPDEDASLPPLMLVPPSRDMTQTTATSPRDMPIGSDRSCLLWTRRWYRKGAVVGGSRGDHPTRQLIFQIHTNIICCVISSKTLT